MLESVKNVSAELEPELIEFELICRIRFFNLKFASQGYYDTMDAGYINENGYVFVTARADDVINVAGHRISTASLGNESRNFICYKQTIRSNILF